MGAFSHWSNLNSAALMTEKETFVIDYFAGYGGRYGETPEALSPVMNCPTYQLKYMNAEPHSHKLS